MKILANKEIKNLFHSLSLVFGVTFLLAEVFLWLSYRRLSLLLLILFLLAGGAVWAVCFEVDSELGIGTTFTMNFLIPTKL